MARGATVEADRRSIELRAIFVEAFGENDKEEEGLTMLGFYEKQRQDAAVLSSPRIS